MTLLIFGPFFEHKGKVLTLREDGMYTYQPGNTLPEYEHYSLLYF